MNKTICFNADRTIEKHLINDIDDSLIILNTKFFVLIFPLRFFDTFNKFISSQTKFMTIITPPHTTMNPIVRDRKNELKILISTKKQIEQN